MSELRVVELLDDLCEKMQDYTLEKVTSPFSSPFPSNSCIIHQISVIDVLYCFWKFWIRIHFVYFHSNDTPAYQPTFFLSISWLYIAEPSTSQKKDCILLRIFHGSCYLKCSLSTVLICSQQLMLENFFQSDSGKQKWVKVEDWNSIKSGMLIWRGVLFPSFLTSMRLYFSANQHHC